MNFKTKSLLAGVALLVVLAAAALLCRQPQQSQPKSERAEVVILSTNDMHAKIDEFPRLVTAVRECRDTVCTILVDAGDRWTGDGYVDLADRRRPIIDLMNHLGYDVATLGNHEFDVGQATLDAALQLCRFKVLCANMQSDTELLDDVAGTARVETPDGVTIDFAGVVTNFNNGHPDGNDDTFKGLRFESPQECAVARAAEMTGDVKVLLSHMGDDKDMALAARGCGYDIIISGHTHALVDTLINGTLIGQTQNKLKNVGVTRITLEGGRICSTSYENIPLARYAKDAETERMVEQIKDNPEMKVVVGRAANRATHVGLANWQTRVLKQKFGVEVALYHYGGVRLQGLEAGEVTVKDIYDNEPFFSPICTARMTPQQLRRMIVSKYNDTKNSKESHRVDIFASTPYDIVTTAEDVAVDVRFAQLEEGVRYTVALPEYVANNYGDFECEELRVTPHTAYGLDIEYMKQHSPVVFDNTPKQRIVRR